MSDSQINDQIRVVLDTYFNGIIIDEFGCGVYTVILAQAIWKLHKKGNKAIYSCSLILLWIFSIILFARNWATFRAGFVVHNNSPIEIFSEILAASRVVQDVTSVLIVLISDAILVWRCNILWQKTIILIPLLTLYATTAVFYIWVAATKGSFIVLAGFIAAMASALTTLAATFLIASKIVLVTRQSRMHHSYTKIIEIIVESGALVSTFTSATAILQLISFWHAFDLGTTSGRILTQLTLYVSAIQGPIIGIAPTLIAFRVVEEPPRTEVNAASRSSRLSRLTFRRTARDTTSDTQARDPHVSTIRFMSAQEEVNLNNSQESVVAESQANHPVEQEEQNKLETIGRLTGPEPA